MINSKPLKPEQIHSGVGFILTRHRREIRGRVHLEYWLSTDSGPLKVVTKAQQEVFFICDHQSSAAKLCLANAGLKFELKPLNLKTFKQQPVAALYFDKATTLYIAREALNKHNIECFEYDIRLTERFLMERFIYGAAYFSGLPKYQRSGKYLAETQLKTALYSPQFKVISFDIECSEHGELYCIGLAGDSYQNVLMIGAHQTNAPSWITWVKDEADLIRKLLNTIKKIDPDIFIGWNVINFDFRLLIKRAALHRIALTLGRNDEPIQWRDARGETNQGFVTMPGRVIVDGIDALKSATYHFDSFSLEFVAQTLLGKGKKTADVDNRLAEITADFLHNKVHLAEYNLQDCVLVLDIFAHTQLLSFLTLRSQLTGLELDRMGGSVAAFINLYLPKLHRAGYIAPNRPSDGGLASPGGYVMDSQPGLYDNVLVLDFKSLYPSIIRTFKVDPLGLIEGLLEPSTGIPGFKGAVFSRDKHFLPDIIKTLWEQRDTAKKTKDAARSQAIKILMNSFYGVLGSGGCPFYDTRLASSITMRGHEIMQTTAKWITNAGYKVIYGDTDSTFVWLDGAYTPEQAQAIGLGLQKEINSKWRTLIEKQYQLDCQLEIEFETYFTRFLMPTIRGSKLGSKKRYAGVKQIGDKTELIFKGLETVRSDWTPLAKHFQHTLFTMVFAGDDIHEYIKSVVADTYAGKLDNQLVYRKRLRRKLDHYVKNVPPHVKAARIADTNYLSLGKSMRYQNKGWISYVITLSGPEPIEFRNSPIDYEHYIEKQIQPIAEGILPFIGISFTEINKAQLGLF